MHFNSAAIRRRGRQLRFAVVLLVGVAGCDPAAEPVKKPAAPVPVATGPERYGEVEYTAPPGWSSETLPDDTLLLLAPGAKSDWPANLSLHVLVDNESRSLEQGLDDIEKNLKIRKQSFQRVDRKDGRQAHGLPFGLIEYTWRSKDTAVTEYEIMIDLGENKRLFVLASAATASWVEYQPVFQTFLDSIRF